MKFLTLLFLVPMGILFLNNCAQGNCRSQNNITKADSNYSKENKSEIPESGKVKVYKYNGETQCGMRPGVDAGVMAKDLFGIKVYSSETKKDGLMHIQQCGSPTGSANIYMIETKDLPKAVEAGFKEWIFD